MAYRIELSACINCSLCRKACPTECISYFSTGHRTHVIDPSGCIDCDLCVQVCPVGCIERDADYVPDPVLFARAQAKAKEWARRRRQIVAVREMARASVERLAPAS